MKEAANFIGTTCQMTQSTQGLGFHVGERENASSPQPVRFDVPPNVFVRVQFRTIPGQHIDAQLFFITPNCFGDLAGLVHGMTVPNQENGFRASSHQAIKKSAHDVRIQPTLLKHKPHAAPPIHCAEHIQAIPCARTAHHRGLSLTSPGRPRMIITAQPRFIAKPDLRSQSLGFPGNRRVFLIDPRSHPLGILLVRPPQGLLGCDTQLCQQTPYRIGAQSDTILLVNHRRYGVACPQGKGKLVLPWILPYHYPIDPCDHAPLHLARAASPFPRVQSIPSTRTIHRQPVVDARAAESHSAYDHLRALTTVHSGHRSFSKFRQNFMLQFPAIHRFLFHDQQYSGSVEECLYYFGLINNYRGASRRV